jgi:hypothetical protein
MVFLAMPIKILFPPEAQKAEKTLRGLGLNSLCDNVILPLTMPPKMQQSRLNQFLLMPLSK